MLNAKLIQLKKKIKFMQEGILTFIMQRMG
jgi:hypothetical protein